MDLSVLTVFGAGLATFATPCVLPVIPLYLATLAGGDLRSLSGARRGALVLRAVLFSVGFIGVFTLLGLGASSLGAALSTHKALVSGVGAVVVAVFALKFLGVVQIPMLDRVAKLDDSRFVGKVSAGSAVLLGALFAAGWSPCVGPVLGSVLTFTAARTTSAFQGAVWLGVYGLGFALPLLVLSAFAEAGTRLLGRVSRFLPVFERAVGALLIVVAGAMLLDATAAAPSAALQVAQTQGATTSEGSSPLVPSDQGEALPRMVELYTPSCPICQRMNPVIDRVTSTCDNKGVKVEAIDISAPQNKALVAQYRVVGVPTFLFLDPSGQEVARLVGEQSESSLYQALSALRGQECPGLVLLEDNGPSRTELPSDNPKEETKAGELSFPAQQQEVVSCRSMSSSVNSAEKRSRSFGEPATQSQWLVPSAADQPGSCSRDFL